MWCIVTCGVAALVEALMGFQFNHVGGGTKTRRPIALHMKYNASCVEPACYLVSENDAEAEHEMSLPELQEHIESENRRLEAESGFWSKDIVAKIEYKFCPNLTIVDTPGLIAAAPGRRNGSMQSNARAVESVVRGKMEQQDHIILCLEDSSDWSNATTRRLVMNADPELRRTVLVATKLDTRLPQFSRASDVEQFLRPPTHLVSPNVLGGGPFFTSVPSGRVGTVRDAVFRTNEHFRDALAQQEHHDVSELERRLDRRLEPSEASHVGVSQLRRYLEKLLRKRYLENVPSIVPVLEREQRTASNKLQETERELESLDSDRLKDRGRQFYSAFLGKLPLLLRGTMMAPPSRFGETLADEHIRGGSFIGEEGRPLSATERAVPNSEQRLFGGAQYHRALEEFRTTVGSIKCPQVTREDIVNASGLDELHDGANYARTACVIGVAKARDMLEPFLHQLGYRMAHVARRLLPISMYLLQREGKFLHGHEKFLKAIGSSFHAFVDECQQDCQSKVLEDLRSTTEFVSWSLHSGNSAALRTVLGTAASTSNGASSDGSHSASSSSDSSPNNGSNTNGKQTKAQQQQQLAQRHAEEQHSRTKLIDLVENTLWSRALAGVTHDVVSALVEQVFNGIRDHFVQAAELKFNCFFLMPLINEFPARLRSEMEQAFAQDTDGVFDVASARSALEKQTERLQREMSQMERIQEKFQTIHAQLCNLQQPGQQQPQPSPAQQYSTNLHHYDERNDTAAQQQQQHVSASRSSSIATFRNNSSQQGSPASRRGHAGLHDGSTGATPKHRSDTYENRTPLSQRYNV